jgi:hypothetical protein
VPFVRDNAAGPRLDWNSPAFGVAGK